MCRGLPCHFHLIAVLLDFPGHNSVSSDGTASDLLGQVSLQNNDPHDPCYVWASVQPEFFIIERLSTAGFPKSSNRSSSFKVHSLPPPDNSNLTTLDVSSNTAPLVRFWNPRDMRLELLQLLKCPILFCCYSEDRLCALPSSPNQWGSPNFDFLLLCHPVNAFPL